MSCMNSERSWGAAPETRKPTVRARPATPPGGKGWRRYVAEVSTASELPPAPRSAQNRSGCEQGDAVTAEPFASTCNDWVGATQGTAPEAADSERASPQ